MKKSFVDRFNEIVEQKRISQSELARKSGITQSSISDWLKGKYLPKQDKVHLLAQALNVSPSYLMGWDDEEDDRITELNIEELSEYKKMIGEATLFFNDEKVDDEDKELLIRELTEIYFDARKRDREEKETKKKK